MSMIKVACAGAGFFAQFHYDAWRRIGGVRLVGACDDVRGKAEATGIEAYDDIERMLERTSPDILDIVLPPPGHARAILAAIEGGVRVVICQKPFCTSLVEAREMTERARMAGTTLVVHENFRFQPWYRAIRTLLDDQALGDVHQATFRLRTGDGQGGRAYLDRQPYFRDMPRFLIHETGVHWIDTFRYLLGEPESVYGDLRQMNPGIRGEDAGYFLLGFKQGARALFDGNRLLDHPAENHRLTLGEALFEGTRGTIALNGFGEVTHREFGSTRSTVVLAARRWQGFGGDCVKALNQHVVDWLIDGTALENVAADYLRVIEIEEAIYRSDEEGRRVALSS